MSRQLYRPRIPALQCSEYEFILPHPDCKYIRESVPIRDVAGQLDLKIAGNMAHCWRPENHEHGDRTPSVGLSKRRNRAKCFVCDPNSLSPIDLVMSVLGLDFRGALKWITSQYEIPDAAKGKHINHKQRWPERFRVGTTGSTLEPLIRSGIWASLTPAECKILPVLEMFTDVATRKAVISYRGIMRYAGVRSQSTVATALKRLRTLHFLRVEPKVDGNGFRACNTYRLCFDDREFQQLASDCSRNQAEAITQERQLRQEARRQKGLLPVNTLSNG